MRESDFQNPIFHDETKAREWLEAGCGREGPICPKCGVVDQATLMKGKSHRAGLYQCNACREPFTVTVGTLYERSHVPLNKWLAATHLMMASKKGMTALQISRMIGVTYKTAWFLCHRIRESLRETTRRRPLGGEGVDGGSRRDLRRRQGQATSTPSKRNGAQRPAARSRSSRWSSAAASVRSLHVADVNGKNLGRSCTTQIDAQPRT